MNVLVLGGAGYIGSVLCAHLKEMGDYVIVYDKFLYGSTKDEVEADKVIYGDICDFKKIKAAIDQSDAIVNLAAISNDPASDLNPQLTWEVNFKANENIAELAKVSGKRVIFASSCSVYGFSQNEIFTENSQLHPVTLYAQTKMLAEDFYKGRDIDAQVLRFATVYGHSPKPRFDLVVNTMIGTGYFNRQIIVNGGDQWRPIVHVDDVARAIRIAIHVKKPKNRIYNVGTNEQNFKVSDIAELIAKYMPQVKIIKAKNNIDKRSYRVNFDKFQKDFHFSAKSNISDAVVEINQALESKEIVDLEDDEYYRVKYLKKHLSRNIIARIIEERYRSYTLTKQI